MSAIVDTTAPVAERSSLSEWRRLVITLLLVLSPSLVCGAALEGLSWRIGETMPMSLIAQWQDGAPDRIWRGGDGHSFLTYKLARVADLKPEIIALGPSRANAFRGDAMAPYSFYNAGLTSWTFDQYRRFLELATRDGYAPRAIVFNLDYWMFSAGFDHYWVDRFDERPSTHVADLLRVGGELWRDPRNLWRRLTTADRAHGLYAVLTDDGFRSDGSMSSAPPTLDAQRLASDGTGVGTPPVVLADHIAPEQVAKFDAFVAFAKSKNIALIGVQMPFYAPLQNGLNSTEQVGIWREFISAEWRQHLAASGVVFFDYSYMPGYDDKPEYFTSSLEPDARLADNVMRLMMADPRVRALLAKVGAPEAR